jgi:hypothetical protein
VQSSLSLWTKDFYCGNASLPLVALREDARLWSIVGADVVLIQLDGTGFMRSDYHQVFIILSGFVGTDAKMAERRCNVYDRS